MTPEDADRMAVEQDALLEAAVRRIMDAADRFWAAYGDLKKLARAELERVVRETVR